MSRILILGANGMLGHAVLRSIAAKGEDEVFGSVRTKDAKNLLPPDLINTIIVAGDVQDQDVLMSLFCDIRPDVVINCIGLVKQLVTASDPLAVLPVNAILPHRIARLCKITGSRLIHISTDCVFSGRRGQYTEQDVPDAEDLYGRSKLLGEVSSFGAITLRTSIIGHQLGSSHGLIGWFLAQKEQCHGYSRAIFSGLPTTELARVIRDMVIPRTDLSGLYHVASEPISKLALLELVADVFNKQVKIIPDESLVIDRSLRADRFWAATGYVPPTWPELINALQRFGR